MGSEAVVVEMNFFGQFDSTKNVESWSRQNYLTMSLSKRCKMLGILLCEFGLDVVPKNRKTLAAQLLKLPERRIC